MCIPFVEHIFYKPGNDVLGEAYNENTFGNIASLHPAHSSKEMSHKANFHVVQHYNATFIGKYQK